MAIQVFVDESGGRGQGPLLVFAGVAATAEAWAAFSVAWQDTLDAEPKIRLFKTHDASRRTGEFARMSAGARDAKVRALGRIIDQHVDWATFVALDIVAFDDALKIAPQRKPLDQPYFWAFQVMMMAACFELLDHGSTEPCEITFDEQKHFGRRAKGWYPVVRQSVNWQAPEILHLLPAEPRFGSDDDLLPLQAADFFAWSLRRALSGSPPGPCDFVFSDFKNVRPSQHQQLITKERILWWIAESRRILAEHGPQGLLEIFGDGTSPTDP